LTVAWPMPRLAPVRSRTGCWPADIIQILRAALEYERLSV
jgi:hypothetical protein